MINPRVSVIIPVYNRGSDLKKASASVLVQTMPDFELLIVDDASTDDTLDVAQAIAKQDRRVSVIKNTGRNGPAGARNAGIHESKADLIAFLDSDDVWMPEALDALIDAMRDEVVLAAADFLRVYKQAGRQQTMKAFLFETMIPWWESDPYASKVIDCSAVRKDMSCLGQPEMVLAMALGNYLWISTSIAMVRRMEVEAVGGFDEKKLRGEDMDLWMKLIKRGRFAYVDKVLMHTNSDGREDCSGERYKDYDAKRNYTAYGCARVALWHIRSLRDRFNLNSEALKLWHERMAVHHRICGYRALCQRLPVAIYHYALCLVCSSVLRQQLRREGRRFFGKPW